MKPLSSAAFAHGDPFELTWEEDSGDETQFHLLRPGKLAAADKARWDRLGEAAATGSVFAAPWFMRRSLAYCDRAEDARLAVVATGNGEWLGALPIVPAQRYGRVPFPHWAAWRHPNMFEGTPLVRRGQATRFWQELLACLARHSPSRGVLRLFDLPPDEPVNAALFALCRDAGHGLKTDRSFARAQLKGARAPLPTEQRRRIEGLWRKLEREHGSVDVAFHREPAKIAELLPRFLLLESSGWKGGAGSALDCAQAMRSFFAEVCQDAADRGHFEMAVLSLAGRQLAMVCHFEHKGQGFGFKMAYDEAFAAYAPGLLLLDRLTDHIAALPLTGFDSCCAPGQQPVERLWAGRRELVDCGIAMGGLLGQGGLKLLDLLDRVRQPKDA